MDDVFNFSPKQTSQIDEIVAFIEVEKKEATSATLVEAIYELPHFQALMDDINDPHEIARIHARKLAYLALHTFLPGVQLKNYLQNIIELRALSFS